MLAANGGLALLTRALDRLQARFTLIVEDIRVRQRRPDAHARLLDAAGWRKARLNACCCSLCAVYWPNWMDRPMLYAGNRLGAPPGMLDHCCD
jgi:hypothetical protein